MKVKGTQNNRIGNMVVAIPQGFSVAVATKESLVVVDENTGSKYRYLSKNKALDLINKNLEILRKVVSPEEYQSASEKCDMLKKDCLSAKSIFQKIPPKGKSMDKSMTFRFAW